MVSVPATLGYLIDLVSIMSGVMLGNLLFCRRRRIADRLHGAFDAVLPRRWRRPTPYWSRRWKREHGGVTFTDGARQADENARRGWPL
jgi:hypothetical protein